MNVSVRALTLDRAWVVYLQGNIMITNNNSLPYSTFLILRDFERKAVKLAITLKIRMPF